MSETITKAAARFPNGQMLVSTESNFIGGETKYNRAYDAAVNQLAVAGLLDTVVPGIFETTSDNTAEGTFLWSDVDGFDEMLGQEYEIQSENQLTRRLEDRGWMDAFEQEDRERAAGIW